jgi:NADH dehydrogenase
VHFSGFVAWMLWLVIHLMNLVSFRNRLLVLVQWGWNYFTHDRSARLITEAGASHAPLGDGALPPSKSQPMAESKGLNI